MMNRYIFIKIFAGTMIAAVVMLCACWAEGVFYKLPWVNTYDATNITRSSAIISGKIVYEGNPPYTERGVVYARTQDPTTADNKLSVAGKDGDEFTANVKGLTANTRYYARAYATNKAGTEYGAQVSFTTKLF